MPVSRPDGGGDIRRFTIDNLHRRFEVEISDGSVHREPFVATEDSTQPGIQFDSISYLVGERTLTLAPKFGLAVDLDVYDGGNQRDRLRSRPVVYLDQNKWILLGQAINSPKKVPVGELAPAKELIHLAEQGRVILPLSSGHAVEAARVAGPRREILAHLMVRLSRGWLMKDPLIVRQEELRGLILRRRGDPVEAGLEAVTLDPLQFLAEGMPIPQRSWMNAADDPGWAAMQRLLLVTLPALEGIFAALLEDSIIHSEFAYEGAKIWGANHQALAEELSTNSFARSKARQVTFAQFVSDLKHDIAVAAAATNMSPEELNEWMFGSFDEDLGGLPYLGRMRDVIHLRLQNKGDRWEPNDLIDMVYLPYAAGYTDFVVTENKARHYLKKAEKSRNGAKITSSVSHLVELLTAKI